MKKSNESSKEKYINIINQCRKYKISIFIVFSICILIDIILVWGLGKEPFFGRYIFSCLKRKNFHIIVFFILSLVYLFHIRISKNEYFKNKNITKWFVDIIFIFEFFYIIILDIGLLLPIFVKNDIDVYGDIRDFLLAVLSMGTVIYIINSTIKNIINTSWKFIIKLSFFALLFITFLGMIDLNNLGLLTLICTIMSQFMSYDNIKYLYGKISKVDYSTINEEKTKEQISFAKVIINFIIIFLYFYIVLTEGIKIPQIIDNKPVEISTLQYNWDNILKYIFENIFKNGKIHSFFWKGIIRFGILYILLVIVVICIIVWDLIKIAFYSIIIFWHSKIFKNDKKKLEYSEKKKKEYEKKHFQFDLILKKYLKKNIIRVKRHIEMNKSKINKTNIKTSIHINSRKKSHRLYKYKNIEFHNKKPNSN